MLKISKDVTIRHDGREIYCKAGQIVNVKGSFDINDEVTKGLELRYAQKCKGLIMIASVASSQKAITLNPCNIHNAVEQEIRESKESEDSGEIQVDVEPEPEPEPDLKTEELEKEEETTAEPKKKAGRPRK